MEYTQWVIEFTNTNGKLSLNPCCNGIYSMSAPHQNYRCQGGVLILVVMEYTQWEIMHGQYEYLHGLNPCCNGIYSMSW